MLFQHLIILQYLYWEKVQPTTGPKYDPLSLLSPLMRNWTEAVAERRDKYDYDYGRGEGLVIQLGLFYFTLKFRSCCSYGLYA